MARLPLTVFYTTTVLAAGAALTVLGAKSDPRLLGLVIGATAYFSIKTFNAGFAPDLRYWNTMPQALVFSTHELSPYALTCLNKFKEQRWLKPRKFL